jgi:isoleucyl-tRNA synthetase
MSESPESPVFAPVPSELDFPAAEARTLAFWKERGIFGKTLSAETRATGPSKGTFVFYEGPPTANGMPHNGHVLTRAVKDVFPRYKTMQGYDVPRKAGWDTHGLPVEVEVEKELKIHGKAEIVAYGMEPFIARCIDSVFRYTDAWEKLTDRIGFWVDLESAYVTYHRSYVESVWWALSELHKKGLLYRGHRVSWWWPQGGTALSSMEVGSNYKTVDDPSVYVAFPLVSPKDPRLVGASLCAWTTTPWTLPSNAYAAVGAAITYALVDSAKGKLIVAKDLVAGLEKKLGALAIVAEIPGSELVGERYHPPFGGYYGAHGESRVALAEGGDLPMYFRVLAEDFVTLDAGTGIVHVAPAFGEDDFEAHKRQLARYADPRSVPLLCAVRPDGTLTEDAPGFEGLWVKAADPKLIHDLAARGLLVHEEKYRHEYPFCWRADDDPLIQLARPAWYIRTTGQIASAIANNRSIHWLPDHVKEGRFGDFLANNVDWALSRERFWGTPLNVWVCSKDESHEHAPGSVAEIEALNPHAFDHFHAAKKADPKLNDHLLVHKPWVDAVTFPCAQCGAEMRRVSEVIDAWFDSGSMPFAQWGFPHAEGSKERFDKAFPADFISEAIDQTRGWFYSLLMVSTLVFDETTQERLGLSRKREFPHPYKTCVVLGHVCDREGKKESKSKGNYTPPEVILERVRMEFAAARATELKVAAPKDGVAYIAREDYEGLDLTGESAEVRLYRADAEGSAVTMELRPTKMRRRVVGLTPADLERLGLVPGPKSTEVPPNDVPRLPAQERVTIEDPRSKAPGADAFRWFFYAASPPWTNTRHSLSNVRATQKELAVKLRNVFSFFTIYAGIDGFSPAFGNPDAKGTTPADLAPSFGYRPANERGQLDRWMLSELALTTRDVVKHLDDYLLYDAAQRLVGFVDALSNWYLRRSRERFWTPVLARPLRQMEPTGEQRDKLDAYFTLYECLVTVAKLLAPFVPFFAEDLYQNLVRGPFPNSQAESVHLVAYPAANTAAIDEDLARQMQAIRELVSLGLSVRTANKLKVRQPLSRADIVVGDKDLVRALESQTALIAEELNVHEVRYLQPGEEGKEVRYALKPNFRALGPKLGKRVQRAKELLAKADAGALRAELATKGHVLIDLDGDVMSLGPEEIEVAVEAAPGFAAAGGRVGVVVIHTTLTDALRDEGLARELQSRAQAIRKELSLGFTERVALAISGSERVQRVAESAREALARDLLADRVDIGASDLVGERREVTVEGETVTLVLARLG